MTAQDFIDANQDKIKYALINKEARAIIEISPGVFVEPKYMKVKENFIDVQDTKYDIYYQRFVRYVRERNFKMACIHYRKSRNLKSFIEQIKKEYPELVI